jgi:hypothetical protein
MLNIVFRAANAVFAVVVAVVVSSWYGESIIGKLLTVLITAGVVALIETLTIWLPRHSARGRQLLDPRSRFTGVWLQEGVKQYGSEGVNIEIPNRFAIFTVGYGKETDNYEVDGAAYTAGGDEHARWESTDVAHFAKDGRAMTYEWTGTITNTDLDPKDPRRTGFCRLKLLDDDSGRGRVDHVAVNVVLLFNLSRVTTKWLEARNLLQFKLEHLKSPDQRNRLAKALVASGDIPIPEDDAGPRKKSKTAGV